MDYVHEYYNKKGFDYEFNRIFETKQKKIVSWQKKFKTRRNVSTPLKKLSKIKLRVSHSTLLAARKSSIMNMDNRSDYSKALSDAIRSFESKGDEQANVWRFPNTDYSDLEKTAGPIEKFEHFEKKIRESFHKSCEEYFTDNSNVLDDVLNLMFHKADNSFTETIKVTSQAIGVVPDTTSKYLNVKYSLWDRIHKLIKKDMKTSKKYSSLPKSAFGKTVENHYKIEREANDFRERWQSYSKHSAHHKDLETFAAVWKNITHLQTTRKFCLWLANNPNIVPPDFLANQGLLRDNLSFDHSATSDSMYDEYNAPHEIIEGPYHKPKPKTMIENNLSDSVDGSASLGSVDISDINIIV